MTVSKDYLKNGIEVEENGVTHTWGIHHFDRTKPQASLFPEKGPKFLSLLPSAVLDLRDEYVANFGKEPDLNSPTFHEFATQKSKQQSASLVTPPTAPTPPPTVVKKSPAKTQAPTATPLSPKQKKAPVVAGTLSLLMHFQSRKKKLSDT